MWLYPTRQGSSLRCRFLTWRRELGFFFQWPIWWSNVGWTHFLHLTFTYTYRSSTQAIQNDVANMFMWSPIITSFRRSGVALQVEMQHRLLSFIFVALCDVDHKSERDEMVLANRFSKRLMINWHIAIWQGLTPINVYQNITDTGTTFCNCFAGYTIWLICRIGFPFCVFQCLCYLYYVFFSVHFLWQCMIWHGSNLISWASIDATQRHLYHMTKQISN